MPSKSKNKTKDFCKTKLRVGKTKPAAGNATRLDFKSASLQVSVQTFGEHSDPALSLSRALTLAQRAPREALALFVSLLSASNPSTVSNPTLNSNPQSNPNPNPQSTTQNTSTTNLN